jgi:magnesium chelatase family protein
MEEGHVVVSRKGASVRFKTEFQLVAATNPCPCGYDGDRMRQCTCPQRAVNRYKRRLSGPLVDRFDIAVRVPRVESREMAGQPGEASEDVAQRVASARHRQSSRGCRNARLGRSDLDGLPWVDGVVRILESAMKHSALTGRGWDRVRRVAVTIADLAGADSILESHVAEALAYRGQR